MISKIISGIGGVLLVFLLVMGPGWIAERFEVLETSSGNILPYMEIIENSTVSYSPYVQFNETSDGPIMSNSFDFTRCRVQSVSGAGQFAYLDQGDYGSIVYDINGYKDLCTITTGWSSEVRMIFGLYGSAEDLYQDGANTIYFRIEGLDYDYYLYRVQFIRLSPDYREEYVSRDLDITGLTETRSGNSTYEIDISEDDFLTAISDQALTNENLRSILIEIRTAESHDEVFFIDYQVSPEFYEEVEYNNQSIYVPLIQGISNPYHWHKWSLGIGGVLLCSIALISTPMINFTRKKK